MPLEEKPSAEDPGCGWCAKLRGNARLVPCTTGKGRVLSIAGSDSGGGAGIQADIKTVTVLGGYAMTAITALTAQNTLGVQEIFPVDPEFVKSQIKSVMTDIGADCIKIGMLHTAEIIAAVADALEQYCKDVCLVVDPVMVAKGGASLLNESAMTAFTTQLLPRTDVLTPNVPEAEALTGMTIQSVRDQEAAARKLAEMGPKVVVVKGGHIEDEPQAIDVLYDSVSGCVQLLEGPRIASAHTHGTGCTFSSAIATGIAQNMSVDATIRRAKTFVFNAIKAAPGLGQGHGPLGHSFNVSEDARNPTGPICVTAVERLRDTRLEDKNLE